MADIVKSADTLFGEKDECITCVNVLCKYAIACHQETKCSGSPRNLAEADNSPERLALDRFVAILDKYQEQSHLIDPFLEEIVGTLMESAKTVVQLREKDRLEASGGVSSFPFQIYRNNGLHLVFTALYTLCKVRGYKAVVKQLPHEVAELEPTLLMLQCQDSKDHSTWETRYSLLLWLSMLVLIPFDLDTVDSNQGTNSKLTLVGSVLELCKGYLSDPGPPRGAASLCLARLTTRPDMESRYLEEFLGWAAQTLEDIIKRRTSDESLSTDTFLITGVFQSLVEIFKYGHREKLVSHIPIIFSRVLMITNRDGNISSLERKLTMKLVQRSGLNFLPPKVVKWRYQRGQRSLLHGAAKGVESAQVELEESEDEDVDIPEEVEDVIEKLLCGLRDRDTIVRWSAAKGIGRITSRLPEELADDVVAYVLELFDVSEGDSAWHGGCLALAELARRGLLLPNRLDTVVPFVVKALVYDVRRGYNSVGANVRDAACYVCWAFARAYEPDVMAPHVGSLAPQMLVTAVFDREVNCRRAASAAFQENVGRQGHDNFQYGVEILTAADYFTLGNRTNAFMEISAFVSKYEPYRKPLIDHLVSRKLVHWDLELRILSSKTFSVLTPKSPDYIAKTVLKDLLPMTLSPDMLIRHGATLGVGEITKALAAIPYSLDAEMLSDIRNTIMRIEKARLYRGRGGEWMRVAACQLIGAIAYAGHPLSARAQLRLLDSIDESLKHPKDEVKNAAVDALRALSTEYFGPNTKRDDGADVFSSNEDVEGLVLSHGRPLLPQSLQPVRQEILDRLVYKYCLALETNDPNPAVRRGCALALGALPARFLAATPNSLERVVKALVGASKLGDDPDLCDAETRRNAVLSLGEVVESVGIEIVDVPSGYLLTAGLSLETIRLIFRTLLDACNDYEADNRGDVGSWVRCAAMKTLVKVVRIIRQFPSKTLEIVRSHDSKFKVVSTKSYGDVEVIRMTAGNSIAWVRSKGDNTLLKVSVENEFSEPAECDAAFGMLPDAAKRAEFVIKDVASKATSCIQTMTPLEELGKLTTPHYDQYLNPTVSTEIVCALIKQLCEKMGNVRDCAGDSLTELLEHADDVDYGIPFAVVHLDTIRTIFDVSKPSKGEYTDETFHFHCNWKVESDTFPRVSDLLSFGEYIDAAVGGLVLSVGDLTESVSKNAANALTAWCKEQKSCPSTTSKLTTFAHALLRILRENPKCDRVTVPTMKTIAMILEAELLSVKDQPRMAWLLDLHDLVKAEIKGCTNVTKLLLAGRIFFQLALFARPARTVVLGSILILLGHAYPKVRAGTAKEFNMWALSVDAGALCGPNAPLPADGDKGQPEQDKEEDFLEFLKEQTAMLERELAARPDAARMETPDGFDPEDAFDKVQDIIAETCWDAITTKQARAERDKLYALLLIPKPSPKVKSASSEDAGKQRQVKNEEDSYATLIKQAEMGY
uniref:Tubulin-specific chaperone D n=1 Tax=Mucochytrium quahogii TaxID=96639 RepID=A0A7S2WC38_9STRA|mmetsp:Transcript_30854/g.49469  ORF Transcript_30854/g.49469 Transcript_30854/m.49469 type:complete len:1452 (-) Transcript_30854:2576-6931(-)|eukprot:CAMPEP_0203763856 /NCGR_PEP_ID=MMETSP0098-20131031/16985_1 /ASSEMBLY_ACC=CAM_ASM_000208 /TAXON_ID=96639 /ORGANISM=" , Strain NY0313808BC1" /LENGTH=1451 /DNA_ID=CAMNT_0050659165 /DNA_START=257 /DNA_END=4612 /DNA_ORIENTATION=-